MSCDAIPFHRRVAGYIARAVLSLSSACFAMCGLLLAYDRTALIAVFVGSLIVMWILTGFQDWWHKLFCPFSLRRAAILALAAYSMAKWAVDGIYGIDYVAWVMAIWRTLAVCAIPFAYMLYEILIGAASKAVVAVLREAGLCALLTAVLAVFGAVLFAHFAYSYPAWLPAEGSYMANMPYAFDGGIVLEQDAFFYHGVPVNDVRNMFFGLSAMPAGAACHVISDLWAMLSGTDAYVYVLGAAQAVVCGLTVLLFACLMADTAMERAAACMLLATSWMAVMNIIVLEQYIFPVFWLASFLYLRKREPDGAACLASGIMACGGILSTVLLPLPDARTRRGAAQVGKLYGLLAVAAVLTGSWWRVLMVRGESLSSYTVFLGAVSGIPFKDRLWQFLVFARSVFIMPPSGSHMMAFDSNVLDAAEAPFWLQDVPAGPDVLGLAVFAAMFAGFWLSRDDRFSRTCLWWTLVSFGMLCLAGWGTYENSLVIYNLYFGWAYIGLVFRLFQKLCGKRGKVLLAACVAAGTAMAAVNIRGLVRMMDFLSELAYR